MRVLLDINVVLDVFLARTPWLTDSAAVFQANHEGRITAYLSAAAVPTIHYIVRRHASLEQAGQVVTECLDSFQIVPVDRATLELAQSLPGSDYEDNIHSACATSAQLAGIVTRDVKGFVHSPIPVWSPEELAAQFPKPSPPRIDSPSNGD